MVDIGSTRGAFHDKSLLPTDVVQLSAVDRLAGHSCMDSARSLSIEIVIFDATSMGFSIHIGSVTSRGKVHVSQPSGRNMAITLMQSTSSKGDIIFTIDGDLPAKHYRGEGRYVVELLNQQCLIENNANFFTNGFDISNGRGFLAALFIFHPTWNALGSFKEMIHMGFEPSKEITTVRTNMSCPDGMLELLQNDWMLPNLRFEFVSDDTMQNLPPKKPH